MNENLIKEAMTPYLVRTLSKFIKPISRAIDNSRSVRYLSTAKDLYKKKGPEAALGFLASTKDVTHNIGKIPSYYKTSPYATGKGKFFRSNVGNTANMAQTLSKGVRGAGWKAPIQVSKNLLTAMGRDVRSSRYKTLSTDNTMREKVKKFVTKKDAPNYKNLKIGDKIRKKKIVGIRKAQAGGEKEYLVKKTPIGQTVGMATSAPAWGAYSYFGHKDRPRSQRAGRALTEATAWTVAPTATAVGSILKDIFKNKNKTV